MASVSWTASTSGTWSTASNWSVATGPEQSDDVSIPGTFGPITITYNAGNLSIDSLSTNGTGLSVTAGALGVTNGYSLTGSLSESGGLLRLVAGNYGNVVNGSVSQTGGTLAFVGGGVLQGSSFSQGAAGNVVINRGSLIDQSGFTTLLGTVSGNGALVLSGPNTTLGQGFVLSTGAAVVQGGTVYLNENLTYGGDFTLSQAGTLNLGTSTLTLTGESSLNGIIASSALNLSGNGHFNGLTLENGTLLSLSGTYSQTGQINLGQTGTGTLSIGTAGRLRITGNDTITNSSLGGTLINAGTLIKSGGNPVNGTAAIYATVMNTGTINASIGTIAFWAPSNGSTSTLNGTITGAGTVAFDAGNFAISSSSFALTTARTLLANSASMTLTASNMSYAGNFDQTGGTLVVGVPGPIAGGSTLTLTGLDAFDGGLLKGTGTVLCSGNVNLDNNMALEGNLTFGFGYDSSSNTSSSLAATISQTGTIQLGAELDAITLANIGANESWLMKGPSSILGSNGTITNYGLFEKQSGAGDSLVQDNFVNTAGGTLVANSGMLTLSGGGTLAGSVTGSAALDITGSLVFANGLSLTTGELILDDGQIALQGNLAYTNDWAEEGGTLALGGNTLSLSGITSLESGVIQGPGLVTVSGPAVIGQGPNVGQPFGLVQGAQLLLEGNTEQHGTITLTGGSVAPTLTIASGATYTLDSGADIGVPNSSVVGTFVVAGTLVAAGAGLSVLTAAIVDNGVIRVSNGDLSFIGPLNGSGGVNISNGGTLELNDTSAVHNAIGFGAGGGVLSLLHPTAFQSTIANFTSGDVVELQGFAFSNITPVINGNSVTLTEANGQSMTLNFNTAQTASSLMIGEGPHGGLALIHL